MAQSLFVQLARRFDRRRLDLDRRAFLKALGYASGALLSGCATGAGRAGRVGGAGASGPRVIIVGAGLSGLSCAFELESVGCRVTLLEARSKSGGRVLTWKDWIPGKVIEGGAELIGENHPLWLAYAQRFGLRMRPVSVDDELPSPVVLGGDRLTTAAAKAVFEEMDRGFAELTADAREVDAFRPWLSPGAPRWDAMPLSDRLVSMAVSELGRLAMAVQLGSDNAVDVSRQSTLGNLALIKGGGLEDFWTKTEVYRCWQGNQALPDALERALRRGTLRLGTPVRKVETTSGGAVVTTASGARLECDALVLAVPPTVYGRMELPEAVVGRLRPQMGSAVKSFSRVRSAFWKDAGTAPTALSDGPLNQTWEGTDHQPGPGVVLNTFSGGGFAEACRRGWAERGGEYIDAELSRIHPGIRGAKTSGRFMDWPSNPWIGCGYAFPAPGELTRIGAALQEPNGPIHLAGEHTCPAFVGYMEGALQSGARVSRQLAVRFGLVKAASEARG